MTPTARRKTIQQLVLGQPRLRVEDLARDLGASVETIRRDLALLDRQGQLRRVHGGAVAARGAVVDEGPLQQRMAQAVAAKRAIARHVAAGLQPGDSLFLDTGSTTLFLAEALASRKGLIVITNSADIAIHCQRGAGSRVVLIGGEFRAPGRETVGGMAVDQIAGLGAAQAILTVAAVTERGFFDIDPQEAEIARMMIRQAKSVTILADSSKMGRAGVFEVCPMARATRLVTDAVPTTLRDSAQAAGVRVEIVATE